jgi:hypothetical protein
MTPPPLPPSVDKPKPGIVLLVVTALLLIANAGIGFMGGMVEAHNISFALGRAVFPILFPLIVALLFSIGKGFRNPRSQTKVVMWTALILFLLTLLSAAGRVVAAMPR